MADLTVTQLIDRIHAINQTITLSSGTLTAFRYWPRSFGAHTLPAIVPFLGAGTHNEQNFADVARYVLRTIRLFVPVDNPNNGLLTETAQLNAEAVITPVLQTYRDVPFLELSGTALNGVIDKCVITSDTGITLNPQTGLFQIEFTLQVPMVIHQ